MTVEVPEPLAGRLATEAARRGVDPATLAVQAIQDRYGNTGPGHKPEDPLDAFIGCGRSGNTEPFDIHTARAELAARRFAEGA